DCQRLLGPLLSPPLSSAHWRVGQGEACHTGTGAEKSGVCPALEVDLNCRQEFLSDGDCADNLKCCWLAVPPSARHPKQVSCPELDINYPQLSLGRDQCKANSRCQASGDAASVCGMASHITHVF
uniref:WAP domain-containing protein n=1 Tax=Sus scrofa TaxID=9823 RepID=A0A8D0T3B8_PIG